MKYLSLFLFLILFMSCSKEDESSGSGSSPTVKHSSAIDASNDFCFDLYQEAIKNETADKNVMLSPLSISTALSMLVNGADGNSKSNILNTLRLNMTTEENNEVYKDLINSLPKTDPKVKMSIANSIWSRQGFDIEVDFINTLKDKFNAEATSLDFSDATNAKNTINNWVADATNQKIKTIVEQITSDHVLFLINAIYFNAPWTKEFDPKKTFSSSFRLPDGSSKSVDFMHSSELEYDHFKDDDVEIVRLPYGDKKFHLTAILPNDFSKTESELSVAKFKEWSNALTPSDIYDINFPKFELNYKIKLNQALSAMGMSTEFTGGANFSKINKNGGLKVSEVMHKTYMKVNEEGTEAAAVTSIGIVPTSVPPTISFNKPFFLFITEEETGAILFSGRIMNP